MPTLQQLIATDDLTKQDIDLLTLLATAGIAISPTVLEELQFNSQASLDKLLTAGLIEQQAEGLAFNPSYQADAPDVLDLSQNNLEHYYLAAIANLFYVDPSELPDLSAALPLVHAILGVCSTPSANSYYLANNVTNYLVMMQRFDEAQTMHDKVCQIEAAMDQVESRQRLNTQFLHYQINVGLRQYEPARQALQACLDIFADNGQTDSGDYQHLQSLLAQLPAVIE